MYMNNVTLVEWQQGPDIFRCTVSDATRRHHTVEIPRTVLAVEPQEFRRGTDAEHVGIVAAGIVLMSLDPETIFHKADTSMVNRAYHAAAKAQIVGGFGN